MAILKRFVCMVCGTEVEEARANSDHSRTCHACENSIADRERRVFLKSRKGMTTEERLSLIEQWIYDYKPPRDIMSVRF